MNSCHSRYFMPYNSPIRMISASLVYAFCCLLIFPTFAAAAPPLPYLVKDINTTPQGSTPVSLHSVGNLLFFTATTPDAGDELWRSDGSPAGTRLLRDIWPGANGSSIAPLASVGNTFFFAASSSATEHRLWKSDGTAAGTVLVKAVRPVWFAGGRFAATIGTTLFFVGLESSAGNELWKSDGTAAGTVLVKDMTPGPAYSTVRNLYAIGNLLYFEGPGGLWKSDGTADGTTLIKPFISVGQMAAIGNQLYFSARDNSVGTELWKSDGTTAGTVLVKEIQPGGIGGEPTNLIVMGNKLYFTAYNAGLLDNELWQSDGTDAGTQVVKDIRPGSDGSFPGELTVMGNLLYFRANDGTGAELWRSDGTNVGTTVVKDTESTYQTLYPSRLLLFNNALYFLTKDGLWRSDGTAPGTTLTLPIPAAYIRQLTVAGNQLFLSYEDATVGFELWRSDGTTAGTTLLQDMNPTNFSAEIGFPVVLHDQIYFPARDDAFNSLLPATGKELWQSDGTSNGTQLVKDIKPDRFSSGLANLTTVGGNLFFKADDNVHGYELWKSDGTTAGTALVKDIKPGSAYGSPEELTAVGNLLFFTAESFGEGRELWKSDGSEAGTQLVKDIRSGPSDSFVNLLGVLNNVLFFRAYDDANGQELWKSDGTSAGTTMVKDINSGPNSSSPAFAAVLDNVFYFVANDGSSGNELWRSDGTATGTRRVRDIHPGSAGSEPRELTVVGSTLFFCANDGSNGAELWKSDGSEAGTRLVKDISPFDSSPDWLTAVGNLLYFRAYDIAHGYELWKSDGTADGTQLVKDINPGSANAAPYAPTLYQGWLYFGADDGVHGNELWRSDGTAAGTELVADLRPGAIGAQPGAFKVAANRLFFVADDGSGISGELWAIEEDASPTAPSLAITSSGANLVLSWSVDTAITGYEVHRSVMPFFTPHAITRLAALAAGATTYSDSGANSTNSSYYYVVQAINGNQIVDSNRVGKITYPLNNSGGKYSLIALPFPASTINNAATLAGYIGNVSALLKWNPATQSFRFFVPPNAGDNFPVGQGDAIFVAVNSGGPTGVTMVGNITPLQYNLQPGGFTFITLPLHKAHLVNAAQVAADIPGTQALLHWNEASQLFRFFTPPNAGDNFAVTPGAPFIVRLAANGASSWPAANHLQGEVPLPLSEGSLDLKLITPDTNLAEKDGKNVQAMLFLPLVAGASE